MGLWGGKQASVCVTIKLMSDYVPILLLDFDGVCHSYTSGWKGATIIPDDHVPGLFEFLEEAKNHFKICIYSSRSKEEGGPEAMMTWFIDQRKKWREHGGKPPTDTPLELEFPKDKPAAFLTIDDRCYCFDGRWPSAANLSKFRPWNKR